MAKHLARQSGDSGRPPIQFRRGWFWFFAGTLMALVFAFFVRTLLSPSQVRYWVQQALIEANLPVQVEFSEVRLEFSRGFFPWFGLVAKDVSILGQKSCESLSEFKVDRLAIPLSLTGLAKKQVYVSHLYMGEAQFRYMPSSCPEDNGGAETVAGTEAVEDEAQPLKVESPKTPTVKAPLAVAEESGPEPANPISKERMDQAARAYRHFWEQLNGEVVQRLGEVLVENLEILDGRRPGLRLNLSSLRWYSRTEDDSEVWTLRSRMSLTGDWMEGQKATGLRVQLDLGEAETQFTLEGNYKEGKLDWLANYDWNSHQLKLKMEQDQLPVSPILQILKERGVVTNDLKPKFVWLSCEVGYEGPVTELTQKPIQLEPCSLQGDLGEINILKWRWHPWRQPVFDPLEIHLKELDLQKFVKMINRTGPSGVLGRFGKVSGTLQVDNPNKMSFSGELRDVEMSFSNQGIRGKQLVPLVRGELSLDGDRVRGQVPEMELDGGEFAGGLSFNLDRDFRDGVFQVAVDRISFHPSIQKLMVGKSISALSIYGQGKVQNGDLQGWRGDFGTKEVVGTHWRLEDIKLSTEFEEQVFKSQSKVGKLHLAEEGDYYHLVRPLFLDEKGLEKSLSLQRVAGKITVGRGQGQWERLSASGPGRVVLSSSGAWSEDRRVEGKVHVDFPVLKLLRWELVGSWDRIQLQPSAKMLKDLARRHPDMKPPGSLEFNRTGELLVKKGSGQGVEKLKSIGKKVIETARKIIPEESPDEEAMKAPKETPPKIKAGTSESPTLE